MNRKKRTGNVYQRGTVYWIKYTVDGRTIRHSLDTTDPEQAEAKRREIMRPFATAARVDVLAIVKARLEDAQDAATVAQDAEHPPLAIADAWKAYEAATNRPDSSERTLTGYENTWRKFKAWMDAERPAVTLLRDVDATTAEAYAASLAGEGVSSSTFNQYIMLLKLVWRVLEKQARPHPGDRNPWEDIKRKRLQKQANRRHAITPPQLEKILAKTEDADMHDLIFGLAWTGQRLVDVVTLRWDSVDFKRRVITVHPRKTARTGKAVHVPLLPPLADMLRNRQRMLGDKAELVFPGIVEAYERDPSAVSKLVQKTFEKAGLAVREDRPGVTRAVVRYGAHSLRHFYATQALAAGIPAEIVKRITGHTSDDMLSNYEHVDAAMIGGLAEKLSHGKKLLPAATDGDWRGKVRTIAKGMTAKTWKAARKELLELAAN